MLAEYEVCLPGCADRIVQMTEKQSAHRLQMESAVTHGNINYRLLALALAFIAMIVGLTFGYCLITNGHQSSGLTDMIAAFVVPGGAALHTTNSQRKERLEKMRMLTGREDSDGA